MSPKSWASSGLLVPALLNSAMAAVIPAMKVARATPPTERHAVFGASMIRRAATSWAAVLARRALSFPTRPMISGPIAFIIANPPTTSSTSTMIPACPVSNSTAKTTAKPRMGTTRDQCNGFGRVRAATPSGVMATLRRLAPAETRAITVTAAIVAI